MSLLLVIEEKAPHVGTALSYNTNQCLNSCKTLDHVKQIGSNGCTCYLEFVDKIISVPLTEVQPAFLLHVNMCVHQIAYLVMNV